MHTAFEIARSGRPGPVLVDVPKDIQQTVIDYEPLGKAKKAQEKPVNEYQMSKAVKMINEAQRPFIYIGGGSLGAEVSEEIMQLADKIDAPIGSTLMGLSCIPTTCERFLGMQGMHGHYASSMAQNECDLIISIGCRFSDRATGNVRKYAKQAKILQLDIDAAELNKNITVDLGLAGDIHDAVVRLIDQVDQQNHTEWHERVEHLKRQEQIQQDQMLQPHRLTPQALINEIAKYTEESTPIATDVGQHQMWVAQSYPFQKPRTFISSGGLGTMGFGLGAAIGAAFGSKKRTILFTGDGSFGMNLNELATLKTTGAPVVIVVFNNGVLGMVRQWQTLFYNQHYSNTDLQERQSDFAKIAEAFGIPGFKIHTLDELSEQVAKAMAKSGPVLIDVTIDPDEFVLPMLPPGGSMDDIITLREEI